MRRRQWTLHDVLYGNKGGEPRLTDQKLICVLAALAQAVAQLHLRGIAHCDLKPPNILVYSKKGSGHLKLEVRLKSWPVSLTTKTV